MNCVDFDRYFQDYVRFWIKQNASNYPSVDAMEADMTNVYQQWLDTECDWLSGKTPGNYFEQFDDVKFLVKWLCDYVKKKVSVPDQLLERITSFSQQAVEPLLAVVGREATSNEVRMTAIGLLREIDTTAPMQLYIDWLVSGKELDELMENGAESLKNMGDAVVEPLIKGYKNASLSAQECIVDILTDYPENKEVLPLLTELLFASQNKALVASHLGKLGDAAALPALKSVVQSVEINYLDYVEIVNAINELGGEVVGERDFSGDPFYESMKQLEPTK